MKLTPIVSPAGVVGETAAKLPAIGEKASRANTAMQAPDPQALQHLVEQLNQGVGMTGQQVQFSVDHDTGKTVLRVTDAESGALLRQIPGDEALAVARILDHMKGVLIRQKA